MSGRLPLVLPASLILLWPAWTQQPPVAPADQPKFEAGAQEVVLDLVVRDKKGHLVRDLTPQEVEITDDGAPVKLRSFRLIEGVEETKKIEAEKPAEVVDPLRQLRLVTLVFHNLWDVDAKRFFRQATNDMLKMVAEPNLYFSLYTIDQNLQLLQPFTNQHDLLKKQIDRAQTAALTWYNQRTAESMKELQTTAASAPAQLAANPSPGDVANYVAGRMARMQLSQMELSQKVERGANERATLFALLALVREQAQLPGRKVLMFFTQQFTVSEPQVDLFRSIIGTANRANVAVYTIDAKGLVTTSQNQENLDNIAGAAGTIRDQLKDETGAASPERARALERATDEGLRSNSLTALQEFAKETGGVMVAETNDVRAPLRKALEDVRTYYEAAYTPEVGAYDGRFRRLTVRIPSRPDLVVLSRSGYFALPPSAPGDQPLVAYEMPLLRALTQVPVPADIKFDAAALRFAPPGKEAQYTLAMEVPMSGIDFKPDPAKKTAVAHASLLAVVKDAKGEVVQKFSQDIPREVPLDKVELFKGGHLIQTFRADLPPGKYSLETAVMDRNTSKVGVQTVELTVPPPNPSLSISSVSLIRRVDPAPNPPDPEDQLVAKEGKIVPEYTRVAQAGPGRQLSFYFVVYTKPDNNQPVTLNMSVYQNGQLLGGGNLPLPAPDKDGRIPYVASMPGDNFPAGQFEMRVTAKQGAATAEDRLPFQVVR